MGTARQTLQLTNLSVHAQPWQMRPQRSSTGSAFIVDVEKRYIMTNAHVVGPCLVLCQPLVQVNLDTVDCLNSMLAMPMQVSNATTVHVRKPGNSRKWRAHVLCEGKICDLALLSVNSSEFWADDLMPLQFVDVPELQVTLARPC